MSNSASGRFWAVGVGPGDPELLTLKALRIVRQADILYHAGPRPDQGRAWDIVRTHVSPEQQVRVLFHEAMTTISAADDQAAYLPAVQQLAEECQQGRQVVLITEGDPTLYSTAGHVWRLLARLAPDVPIEVVPGVSSITAAAARVGWSLAQRDEPLAIVPAAYHAAELERLITQFPNLCLLKAPRALPAIQDALTRIGSEREAVLLENVGTEREKVVFDLSALREAPGYFALVLARRAEGKRLDTASSPHPETGQSILTGKIWVVGLGPGDLDLLTPRAQEILRQVDVLIGYESYLKNLEPLRLRAVARAFPIGAETERAGLALDLARQGRQVAVVSSGDAGIYGMASILLERAEALPEVEIEIIPGVTAATAAAALLGAPLGHDFACISLSDLLTPWQVIEERLHAAGRGDFILVLYNPVSQRRVWQLPRARDILLRYRPPATPVGIVERAYRPGTRIVHTTLGEVTTAGISMETLLIIGTENTRFINGKMVTPRGYGAFSGRAEGERIGRRILEQSFALIERELGPVELPAWAFAVVRRMIHASADFDYAATLCYHPDFATAIQQALTEGAIWITDTEMVLAGIRTMIETMGKSAWCLLNDPETARLAADTGLTRSAAGMRIAARRYRRPVLVIGNAPTAIEEGLRLIREESWQPAALIALPVGFVGVAEAKNRLLKEASLPYLTCTGRKGGSAVAAAAVNALLEFFGA
ncbi:MAG: precorrin-3B C(17)-methyltransferase [Gemmataceae bacterium]